MIHRHSKTYMFQLQRNGCAYDCAFFLTDNRLITVEAAGRKHTEALGSKPPGASAIRIAAHLIAEAQPRAEADERKGWFGRLFGGFQPTEPVEPFHERP
ncbi:hypothetical protein [Rhodopseudomonas telluris]|uniref:Uncharacterized protein n=1 Tax=Rhodopseudomonas telluris TaxID=644215 RepID=A0ABV6ELU3_9BRAD